MKVTHALQGPSPTNMSCPIKLNEPFYMHKVSQAETCWKDQALIHHIHSEESVYLDCLSYPKGK